MCVLSFSVSVNLHVLWLWLRQVCGGQRQGVLTKGQLGSLVEPLRQALSQLPHGQRSGNHVGDLLPKLSAFLLQSGVNAPHTGVQLPAQQVQAQQVQAQQVQAQQLPAQQVQAQRAQQV